VTNRVVGWTKGRSELGVALFLLAVGILVIVDAARIPAELTQRGPVGPKAVPVALGVLLLVVAVLLARDVLAGGHGEQEAGEDIDLAHRSDWPTVLLLAGAFLANVALIERAGWPVSGAVLFFGSAYALGSRHLVRDALIAIGLSIGTWYLFAEGLGIGLPAGILKGIL
jgi:putative tricarboxylic transport membrane protein